VSRHGVHFHNIKISGFGNENLNYQIVVAAFTRKVLSTISDLFSFVFVKPVTGPVAIIVIVIIIIAIALILPSCASA